MSLPRFMSPFPLKVSINHEPYAEIAVSNKILIDTVNYLENSTLLDTEEVYCWARDSVEADKLWKLSEELVGEKFQY